LEVCGHNINNLDAFMLTKMKMVSVLFSWNYHVQNTNMSLWKFSKK
jgi:hypothetical protein